MSRTPRQAEVKQKYRVHEPVRTVISEPELRDLASQIGPDWEKLSTSLGFSFPEILGFRRDNPWQTEGQAFHMLVTWKQRSPREDQIGILITALHKVKRVDLSDQLIRQRNIPNDLTTPEFNRETRREKDMPRCQDHRREVTQFFCQTCKELICRECIVLAHRGPQHDVIDSGEAALKYRNLIMKHRLPGLEGEVEELKKSLADTSEAKQKFVEQYVDTKKKVQKASAGMIAQVKAEEKRITNEMENLRRERDRKFQEHEKTVSEILQLKKDSLGKATEMLNAPDSVFLSRYQEIDRNQDSPRSQRSAQVDRRLPYMRFKPGRKLSDFRLGELETKSREWELCREFATQDSEQGEPSGARGIAVLRTREIVLAEHLKERLVICNMEGQQQKTIPIQGAPFDVAAVPETDQIAVVDKTKHVKVFTKNGLVAEFPTVPQSEVDKAEVDLRSVAVKKDGTIVVGDIKRKVLTEHRSTSGALLRTIPVKTKPYFLAIDNDRVIVSGIMRKVYVTDTSGDTIFTIKPTIDGQRVKQCNGVCCDSSGIYIAMNNGDEHTGHIHHYNDRGGFVGCLAQDLHLPLGVAFSADGRQLAVADWSGPVKMYQRDV